MVCAHFTSLLHHDLPSVDPRSSFWITQLLLPPPPFPTDEKAGLESLAEEEKKVAELGAPRLGEITKLIIRIRESKEFKVGCACFL